MVTNRKEEPGDEARKGMAPSPNAEISPDSNKPMSESGPDEGHLGKRAACPLCGEAGLSSGIKCDSLFGKRREFMRCPGCRLLFDAMPQDFHYEEGFYVDNPFLDLKLYLEKGSSPHLFAHLILQAERALNLIRRGRRSAAGKGTLWEVGCGPGLLLDLASFYGWKSLGIEPAPEAAKWGKDALGVEIIAKSLQREPPLTDADIVVASEVVEHLESPLNFALALFDSLKVDGVALLTTPNVESRVLTELGDSWVHLGLGYHLVLYSASAVERLLRNAGFQTVEVGTFEGPYEDERLIIIASKQLVPNSLIREVLRFKLETDRDSLELCTNYLRDVVRRFEGEKSIYWQGALHRLVETLNSSERYKEALDVVNQLEQFMETQGWTVPRILEILEDACRNNNRRIFYEKVPTFIGNFYFLRGLVLLHFGQDQKALASFRVAHAIAEKLERLPYKAYEELRGMPPSLHALFHIGYTLLKQGQYSEATAAFDQFFSLADRVPQESVGHANLNLAASLEHQGRLEEANSRLEMVLALAEGGKLPQGLVNQAMRRKCDNQLNAKSQEVQAAQQRLEWQSEELKIARREFEQRLDSQIEELKTAKREFEHRLGELAAVVQQQDAMRRELDARLQYVRYKIADRMNSFVRRIPGLHKFSKAFVLRGLAWRRRRREISATRPAQPPKASATVRKPKYEPVAPVPHQKADLAACTIVAKNYLSHARVLARSFHQHNPECPFFVLIVDRIDGYFEPNQEDFFVLEAEGIPNPDRERILFEYKVLEASTAIKPYFLEYLFRQHEIGKLIYFDPDILVLNSMNQVSTLLDQHSIVLTPHLTSPYNDSSKPSEFQILQSGTYNLGFIALRNSPTTAEMLSWWQGKLRDYCLMAPEQGMHVDQKWVDLVPGLFGNVYILRDPGYNAAYWNLHERRIEVRDGNVTVNGQPGYFYHFSGIELENIETVSRHQDRFRLSELGDARVLFERYRELVMESGWRETKSWPYAFDYFDTGARIPVIARRLYWEARDQAHEFGDPFSTESPSSFFNWLNSGVDAESDPSRVVTRFWYEVYRQRPDVRAAYLDVLGFHRDGFLEWIRNSGLSEMGVDRSFLAGESTPAAQTPTSDRNDPTISWGSTFGINVLGYVHSEKGMGEAVRSEIRNLQAAAIPFVVNNFSDDYGSANAEGSDLRTVAENPYGINLIHVNADQVPVLFNQKRNYFSRKYNIGFWNWELSSFPVEWHDRFRYFKEIWVPSNFVKGAVSSVSPVPVACVPLSIDPALRVEPGITRSHFGLGAETYVFLFMFDFYSYMERKNPTDLVRAFKKAFGKNDDVLLFIKTSHADFAPQALQLLRAECQGANIRLEDAIWPRAKINSLICLADCYASLHRSEGFGLTMSEAMWFGKPVIATGYSGNVDFMHEGNSFLVKYRLEEIEKDYGPYKKGCVWAAPDVDHAVELMRFVYENKARAAAIGQKGQMEVSKQLHPVTVGALIRQHLMDSMPADAASLIEAAIPRT